MCVNLTYTSSDTYGARSSPLQVTMRLNEAAFRALLLRPRVLVDVHKVDTRTTILGQEVSLPVMIAPAALGKLLHPEGEKITVTAAKATNVLQVRVWCLRHFLVDPLDVVVARCV